MYNIGAEYFNGEDFIQNKGDKNKVTDFDDKRNKKLQEAL